jgi:CRP-like cAMP-binding protein
MEYVQTVVAGSPLRAPNREPGTGNALVRKLEGLVHLSDEDRAALERMSSDVRLVEPRVDLIREGDLPEDAVLVLQGFAGRYKHRANGQRQIMAYLLPGDLCDVDTPYLGRMNHAVGTLSACVVTRIPRDALAGLLERHPTIARGLRLAKLAEEATAREWLVNVGTHSAMERVTHLFCELLTRLGAVGLAQDGYCAMPITQIDLGDTLGLSIVHMNRTLQELRRQGLIELRGKHLKVLNLPRLRAIAEFKPAYLQPCNLG